MAIPKITAGLSAGLKPKPTTILKKPPVVKASAPVVNYYSQTSKPTTQPVSSQISQAQQQSLTPVSAFKDGYASDSVRQTANVQDAMQSTIAPAVAGVTAGANTFVRPDGTSYQVSGSGQVVDQPVAPIKVPTEIPSDLVQRDSTDFAAQTQQQPSTIADGLVESTRTTTDDLIKQSEQRIQAEQAAQQIDPQTGLSRVDALGQEQTDLRGELDTAFAQLGTKGQRLEELRQKQGLPSLMDDLAQINKQIASRSAQYSQALLDNQSRPGLITNIQGQASLLKRQQAVEIGAMTAMAEAMQGNFDIANQYISDTIKVEFEDAENEVNRVLEQLQINKENMTSAERKEAAALEQQLFEKQQSIQDAKEERKNVFDIALQAAQNGADSSTLQAITGSGSMEDALGAAGSFLDERKPVGSDFDIMDQLEIAEAGYTVDSNGNLMYTGKPGGEIAIEGMESLSAKDQASLIKDGLTMVGNTVVPAASKMQDAETFLSQTISKIDVIDEVLGFVVDGSSSIVGTQNPFMAKMWWENLTGENQTLLSGVNQLISKETLDSLIAAKKSGATFGALSDAEMEILSNAALQLNSWAEKDDDGNITHFDITEKRFTEELNKIKESTSRIREELNAKVLDNYYSANSQNAAYIDTLQTEFPDKTNADIIEMVKSQGLTYQRDTQSDFNRVGSGTNSAPIGQLSEKYESSGNPGAIGYDRVGGTSYGAWQLAHNNAKSFVDGSRYASAFSGLTFNSQSFINKWKEVAKQDPTGFKESQRKYIEQTHYDPQVKKLAAAGLDLSRRSGALRDVVWSTAVQHGANTRVITDAIAKVGPNASDRDLINAIYDRRWSGGAEFGGSTAAVKRAVKNRFDNERQQALALI